VTRFNFGANEGKTVCLDFSLFSLDVEIEQQPEIPLQNFNFMTAESFFPLLEEYSYAKHRHTVTPVCCL
jgi:hypothetical protein